MGRRDPSPERTLLLRLRSYRLIRRSRWALSSLRLLASFGESLQVVTSPCCPRQLPDVISNSLFLDAGSPTPAVHRVLAPVSSTVPSAFPKGKWVGFPQLSRLKRLRAGEDFRGCRYFVMFRPPSLLTPQIVPTAANTPAGQPGLLRPSRTRFVASPRIGYANRLKTGNWRYRDFHPVRLSALSAAPSPGRALPLRRRSYWLIRRSHWALSSFGIQPRLESPCRL